MKKILSFSLIFLATISLFGFGFFAKKTEAQNSPACKVLDAYFEPSGTISNYSDANKPEVKAVITTENCKDKRLIFSLAEYDSIRNDIATGFRNLAMTIPESNIVELNLKLGEEGCGGFDTPDCNYIFFTAAISGVSAPFPSDTKASGKLLYNCDSDCDEYFELTSTNIGQPTIIWLFDGGPGPFTTKNECDQKIQELGVSKKCYQKITFPPRPPDPTITHGSSNYDGSYELLAPIPGLVPNNVVTADFKIGDYVNNLIKIVIGIAAVLAVLMIVFGGIQWMMSDSFLAKGAGKEKIKNAILGLLLALSSYLILNTINPDLVNINFGLEGQTIGIAADEAAYEPYDLDDPTTSSGYKINGSSFQNPTPTPGVSAFVANLTSGYSLNKIKVNPSSKTATFIAKKSGSPDVQVSVNIEIGSGGISQQGQGVSGDKKTPLGSFQIGADRRFSTSASKAVLTRSTPKVNLGAMFISIVPDRGIGFHGQKDNLLRKTNGCVRMYNDDLILLAPHMKAGVDVEIF